MSKRILITGAAGCIGSWICKSALERGWSPIATDIDEQYHRWKVIMTDEQVSAIPTMKVDITDRAALSDAVRESGAEQIIHTAALQVPFNRSDPTLGAEVNVVGTVNVFEATKEHGLGTVVYASSVAVYGSSSQYSADILPADASPNPGELYGVNKLCNEGTARIYWQQDGIASVALRPHTVYGPGRDAGMTSGPTKAILAAIKGEPYHIGYGGRAGFQYVADIAELMLRASDHPPMGADVFNIRGQVADMADFVAAIYEAVPGSAELISHGSEPLDLPAGMEDTVLREAFGEIPNSTLSDGIAATAAMFSKNASTS